MNISATSEYGLRSFIYLASRREREAIPAHEISEQWPVPFYYRCEAGELEPAWGLKRLRARTHATALNVIVRITISDICITATRQTRVKPVNFKSLSNR